MSGETIYNIIEASSKLELYIIWIKKLSLNKIWFSTTLFLSPCWSFPFLSYRQSLFLRHPRKTITKTMAIVKNGFHIYHFSVGTGKYSNWSYLHIKFLSLLGVGNCLRDPIWLYHHCQMRKWWWYCQSFYCCRLMLVRSVRLKRIKMCI